MTESLNLGYEDSKIDRLLSAFCLEEPDRVPNLEYWVTSVPVLEYVLGKKMPQALDTWTTLAPKDMIEFGRRIGMDAVGVYFSWRPGNIFRGSSNPLTHDNYVDGCIKYWDDLDKMGEPPDISASLDLLEGYIEAARNTGVGVYASLTSFFDGAYLAMGLQDFAVRCYRDIKFVEHIMDALLDWHIRTARAISSYSDELAFAFVNEDISHKGGFFLAPELFKKLWIPRMRKLLAPFRSKNMIITYHTDGDLRKVIPLLIDQGFYAVHPVQPECNNIYQLKKEFGDKICLVGNIHTPILAYGTDEEIMRDVKEHIRGLSPGGGYVLGSSTSIFDGIPPEKFLAMTNATHKYGKYPKQMGK
jgi:uroporphyrinogen decarboxylase